MNAGPSFVDRYDELLGLGDIDGLIALDADDAEVDRSGGVATGHAAIAEYARATRAAILATCCGPSTRSVTPTTS